MSKLENAGVETPQPLKSLDEWEDYMIRYHSFYSWHRAGAYQHLLNDKDREMLPWVQKFNPYDLYSKTPVKPDATELKPYYQDLIARYLPERLSW